MTRTEEAKTKGLNDLLQGFDKLLCLRRGLKSGFLEIDPEMEICVEEV